MLMGKHGFLQALEEVCLKSMGVLADSKQLNVFTREANVSLRKGTCAVRKD